MVAVTGCGEPAREGGSDVKTDTGGGPKADDGSRDGVTGDNPVGEWRDREEGTTRIVASGRRSRLSALCKLAGPGTALICLNCGLRHRLRHGRNGLWDRRTRCRIVWRLGGY
jgi:hypothetical protein